MKIRSQSNINFLIDNFDLFSNKIYKAKLFEKDICQIISLEEFVTSNKAIVPKDISRNIEVFNFYLVHEIKNLGIHKTYKKIYLVIQVPNDKDNNLELIKLIII